MKRWVIPLTACVQRSQFLAVNRSYSSRYLGVCVCDQCLCLHHCLTHFVDCSLCDAGTASLHLLVFQKRTFVDNWHRDFLWVHCLFCHPANSVKVWYRTLIVQPEKITNGPYPVLIHCQTCKGMGSAPFMPTVPTIVVASSNTIDTIAFSSFSSADTN